MISDRSILCRTYIFFSIYYGQVVASLLSVHILLWNGTAFMIVLHVYYKLRDDKMMLRALLHQAENHNTVFSAIPTSLFNGPDQGVE
jgi:hypothetical protein